MAQELSDIDGVGPATKEKLNAIDVENLEDLAEKDVQAVQDAGVGSAKAEKLVERARKAAVTILSTAEREHAYEQRRTVTTGVAALDGFLDGGWNEGEIVCVYGRSSSGKTQLSLQSLVAAVQETGDPAVYIETERDRFRPKRIRQIAGSDDIFEDIFVIEAYDLDKQLDSYGKVASTFDDVSLVVVDSFNGRFRLADQFVDRSTFSSRSQVIAANISAVEDMVDEVGCPVLLTSQIYDEPTMHGQRDIPYGGNIFLHMVTYNVYMKPQGGDLRTATIENHPAIGDEEVEVHITDTGLVAPSN